MTDYTQYFVEIDKQDGGKRTILSDDAPEELKDLIRAIHFDHFYECLPNDWIYQQIHLAFEELALDELDNITIEADIWNGDLAQWFADNCNEFANEISSDVIQCNWQSDWCVIGIIRMTQLEAISRIYNAVNDFLKSEEMKDA